MSNGVNNNTSTNNGLSENEKMSISKLYEDISSKSNELDKYLFAGATGALLLSITFVEKVISHPSQSCLPILFASWMFLTFSIIAIIGSYFQSLNENYEIIDCIFNNKKMKERKINIFKNLTFISFVCLILGFTTMAIFASSSLINYDIDRSSIKSDKLDTVYENISEIIYENTRVYRSPQYNTEVVIELSKGSEVYVLTNYNNWTLVMPTDDGFKGKVIGWIENYRLEKQN